MRVLQKVSKILQPPSPQLDNSYTKLQGQAACQTMKSDDTLRQDQLLRGHCQHSNNTKHAIRDVTS